MSAMNVGRRPLPGFDIPDFELILASDFSEILRQGAGVTLALRDKRHPVVVGFILETDFDRLGDFGRKLLEVLPLTVVDVGIRVSPRSNQRCHGRYAIRRLRGVASQSTEFHE